MGTIIARPRKDGSVAYHAQISIMRDRKIVLREQKTFDRKPAAAAWIEKREAELAKPGALTRFRVQKRISTLADAIDRYTAESKKPVGRTKAQVLATIKTHDISSMSCADITSQDLVGFAQKLRHSVQPQTVANYLSHLASLFAIARPAWGYELDPQAMADAFKVAKRLGLTSKARARDRRPTLTEMNSLMGHFAEIKQRRPSSNPMHVLVAFAVFSTRRLEEITRVKWRDLDNDGSRILVRDMKNPGEKIGNDVWCDLPEPALRIVRTMSRTKDEIFPFNPDAITAAFTRACKLLGIDDLHFHDLRHDGVSRLFEMGLNIPHVAAVSGHRSWSSLKRYTHLRQTGDKYAGWIWLRRIGPPEEDRPPKRGTALVAAPSSSPIDQT
jgi:integrase